MSALLVLLCAAAGAEETAQVRFGWAEGDRATVTLTRVIARQSGDQTVQWTTRARSELTATQDGRTQVALALSPWVVEEDSWSGGEAAMLLALAESIPDAPSKVWMDRDEIVVKIDPAPAVQAMKPLADQARASLPEQAEVIKVLTSTGKLFRGAQDRWDLLMGQWLGRTWTTGLPRSHREKARLATPAGAPLMATVQQAFERWAPCTDDAGAAQCAVFTQSSAVASEDLAGAAAGGTEDRFEATLVLDPDGGRPHRLDTVRTSVIRDGAAPVTETATRSLVFRYGAAAP